MVNLQEVNAKTKIEKEVARLSNKLPKLTKRQNAWAAKQCAEKYFTISRNANCCLECNHKWKDDKITEKTKKCKCPNCKSELEYKKYYSLFKRGTYIEYITTFRGYQLIRMFLTEKWFCLKKKPEYTNTEVQQFWISKEGQLVILSRRTAIMTYQYDQWIKSDDYFKISRIAPDKRQYVESRNQLRVTLIPWVIYPEKKLLPELIRNGFCGDYYKHSPQMVFWALLGSNQAETLLKTNQMWLFDWMLKNLPYRIKFVKTIWPSIRVALRHKYPIDSDWFDHVDTLKFLKMHMTSKENVCPENLNELHQKLHKKRMVIEAERREKADRTYIERSAVRREAEAKRRLIQDELDRKALVERVTRYGGLRFSDGMIEAFILKTIEEYQAEGKLMGHCVSGYWNRSQSLIMTTRTIVGNNPVETIEISLQNFQILQARGLNNQPTERHEEVVALIESNMKQIQKLARSKTA